MDIWFTSDTHFGHANIIKYCNRPFSNVDEMNEALIANWNDNIKPTDSVYHLGDFSFEQKPQNTARRLNGNKHLVRGNHDKDHHIKLIAPFFNWIKDVYELKAAKTYIWLSHFAHRRWPSSHHGAIHLYGHSHGDLDDYGKSTDVGVDAWDYKPVSLDTILAMMKKRDATEHHGR